MSSAAQPAPTAPAHGAAYMEGHLRALREQGRKALVIYVMAGDPSVAFTAGLVPKLAEAGADLIELGFPFSDPVADGPVIQAAGTRALRNFDSLDDFFALVRTIRTGTAVPMVVMTYYNLIFRYGEAAFVRAALAAGLDGAILPDLPVDEGEEWQAHCREQGFASTFMEAPTTSLEQARRIAQYSAGFVYMVSLKGVTGSDRNMGQGLAERVQRLRGVTDLPLTVGFGISTPEQAAQVGALCDGVVVGSGVVGRIGEAANPAAAETAVLDYVRALRAGLDGA